MRSRELAPADLDVLTSEERQRAARFQEAGDRSRFVLATSLLRRAVAAQSGSHPEDVELDRRCRRCGRVHGRPRLPRTGLHASITHSGDMVGVALTRAGAVGLDVESIGTRSVDEFIPHVLACAEEAEDIEIFYRYWTRKEAIVKATGDGITVGLTRVVVSHPRRSPELLAYPGRPGLTVKLADLSPAVGHPAGLAIVTSRQVTITESWDPDLR